MKKLALALLLASTTSAAAWTTDLTPPSATANANAAQKQHQHQAQVQRQKQHQHQSQSVTVNNTQTAPAATGTAPTDPSANGGGWHNEARAPDVVLPPVGGGGSDCPVVGFAAGGSGLGGGGGFGPGWISSRCDHRMYARLIYELTGDREEALRYLASVEPDVRDFVKAGVHVEQPMHTVRPDWCATASIEEKLQHSKDCL